VRDAEYTNAFSNIARLMPGVAPASLSEVDPERETAGAAS